MTRAELTYFRIHHGLQYSDIATMLGGQDDTGSPKVWTAADVQRMESGALAIPARADTRLTGRRS